MDKLLLVGTEEDPADEVDEVDDANVAAELGV